MQTGKAAAPTGQPRMQTGAEPAGPALPDVLTVQIRGYAHEHQGQPVAVLDAGCGLAADDLVVRGLHAEGLEVQLTRVDDEGPLTRAVAAARTDLDSFTLGDLRTVPLLPRSFDIVQCDRLLERIPHAELVLDRLVNALRPGGLLVLRMSDRDCAAGFIHRKLPAVVRKLVWRRLQPQWPGPFPAVYEHIVSTRGIQSFALMRGLVIAERQTLRVNGSSADVWRRRFAAACRLVARLSRGRITAEHDELLYIIRKPESRLARVLLPRRAPESRSPDH